MDKSGVPTFLYEYKHWDINDRIEATVGGNLRRTFSIEVKTGSEKAAAEETRELILRAHSADQLTRVGPMSFVDQTGLEVSVDRSVGHLGELRRTESADEWLIPIDVIDRKQIVVEYSW